MAPSEMWRSEWQTPAWYEDYIRKRKGGNIKNNNGVRALQDGWVRSARVWIFESIGVPYASKQARSSK